MTEQFPFNLSNVKCQGKEKSPEIHHLVTLQNCTWFKQIADVESFKNSEELHIS